MTTLPILPGPSLLDLAVLRDHERELNEWAGVLRFVRTFMDLWESRYGRLAGALEPYDRTAVLDALISIKTSAAMAGAVQLSLGAGEMERAVRNGDHAAASGLLPSVQACGQQTMQELLEHYVLPAENR